MTKKFPKYILYLILTCAIACKSSVKVETIEVPALRASEIIDYKSVKLKIKEINLLSGNARDFRVRLSEEYIKKADKEESNHTDKEIFYLKRSLSIYPAVEIYTRLGNVLLKSKKYEEAFSLYYFLLTKDYQSNSFIFENIEKEWIVNYIICELKSSFRIYLDDELFKKAQIDKIWLRNELLTNKLIGIKPNSKMYHYVYLYFSTEEEVKMYQNSTSFFKTCLDDIQDTSTVFERNEQNISNFMYKTSNEEGFDYYMDEPFRIYLSELKEGTTFHKEYDYVRQFNILQKFKITDSCTAIIYVLDFSPTACPKEFRRLIYKLATFTSYGKIIDEMYIAEQNAEKLMLCNVNGTKILISKFKRNWNMKLDVNEFDNTVNSISNLETSEYEIQKDGKILLKN